MLLAPLAVIGCCWVVASVGTLKAPKLLPDGGAALPSCGDSGSRQSPLTVRCCCVSSTRGKQDADAEPRQAKSRDSGRAARILDQEEWPAHLEIPLWDLRGQ
jgi:hypothetical protein